MEVEYATQLNVSLVPVNLRTHPEDIMRSDAYVPLSQSEIIVKTSRSDLFVSSKPGESTRQMSEMPRSGSDSLKTEILLVQDAKLCPTRPSIPVATSMNYVASGNHSTMGMRKNLQYSFHSQSVPSGLDRI
jgi:hypothetical protein